jgi:hypothetical protein
VQLLAKHGFGVRLVPHAEASRAGLPRLDAVHTRVVCVVHLDMVGTCAHLRFLVQRLRRRLPDAAVVAGLWPEGEEAGSDVSPRDVGADVHAGSLREMVEACAARAADAKADGAEADGAQTAPAPAVPAAPVPLASPVPAAS